MSDDDPVSDLQFVLKVGFYPNSGSAGAGGGRLKLYICPTGEVTSGCHSRSIRVADYDFEPGGVVEIDVAGPSDHVVRGDLKFFGVTSDPAHHLTDLVFIRQFGVKVRYPAEDHETFILKNPFLHRWIGKSGGAILDSWSSTEDDAFGFRAAVSDRFDAGTWSDVYVKVPLNRPLGSASRRSIDAYNSLPIEAVHITDYNDESLSAIMKYNDAETFDEDDFDRGRITPFYGFTVFHGENRIRDLFGITIEGRDALLMDSWTFCHLRPGARTFIENGTCLCRQVRNTSETWLSQDPDEGVAHLGYYNLVESRCDALWD